MIIKINNNQIEIKIKNFIIKIENRKKQISHKIVDKMEIKDKIDVFIYDLNIMNP
jgi:hypothetical protein